VASLMGRGLLDERRCSRGRRPGTLSGTMEDLAVIIVSYNSGPWLRPCLSSVYAHAGDVHLNVVVVDNGSADDSVEIVETEFPQATVIRTDNRGFAAGNNAGANRVNSEFILFLNPDTEILDGTFGELLDLLDRRPSVGLLGCKQVAEDGSLHPTIRRFPSPVRYFFTALGSERLPFDASWLGERVRRLSAYEREVACDWTSGSFMLVRRDVFLAAGGFDDSYFLFSEEPDLCWRVKGLGWDVRHVPAMTILHHAGKAGVNPRLAAQDAHSRQQYIRKNMKRPWAQLALLACGLGYALRAGCRTRESELSQARRAAALRALRTLLGRVPPPFEDVLRASRQADVTG
jgi:N-acetylglucosaminyl-diphospho-decaprenol L-rhamnosyltransferase